MGEEVNKLGMRMKKTRAMWQWRQPGTMQSLCRLQGLLWSWLLAGSESSFFFGPCTHSFSALIRYFLIPLLPPVKDCDSTAYHRQLTRGNLAGPCINPTPNAIGHCSINLFKYFFLYEKGGVPYFAYFIKIFSNVYFITMKSTFWKGIFFETA